jgi:hypothetical protein
VEAAIRALNNANLNDLYLQPDAGNDKIWLGVCGGDGRYYVSGSDVAGYPTLYDDTKDADATEELTIGGQGSEMPANQIVGLAAALAAARDFYNAGGFGGKTRWQEGSL